MGQTAAQTRFRYERGYWGEGQQWVSALLALPGVTERTGAGDDVLTCLVVMDRGRRLRNGAQRVSGDTWAHAAEAVAIARETGDWRLLAQTLFQRGTIQRRPDDAAGRAQLEEALALQTVLYGRERTTGITNTLGGLSVTLGALGAVARAQGETALARAEE